MKPTDKLQQEAEKYAETFSFQTNPQMREIIEADFIAGATSEYVDQQMIAFKDWLDGNVRYNQLKSLVLLSESFPIGSPDNIKFWNESFKTNEELLAKFKEENKSK